MKNKIIKKKRNIVLLVLLFFCVVVLLAKNPENPGGERVNIERDPDNFPEDVVTHWEVDPDSGVMEEKVSSFEVIRVADGDTIEIIINDKKELIRFIGIDTREMDYENGLHECYAREATERVQELIGDKGVSLEADLSQGDRGVYKRLLRYVLLPDGTNLNERLVREGYAYEFTYENPYKYQKEFIAAEAEAKKKGFGLWDKNVCK